MMVKTATHYTMKFWSGRNRNAPYWLRKRKNRTAVWFHNLETARYYTSGIAVGVYECKRLFLTMNIFDKYLVGEACFQLFGTAKSVLRGIFSGNISLPNITRGIFRKNLLLDKYFELKYFSGSRFFPNKYLGVWRSQANMSVDRVWTPWQTAVKELFRLKLVSCV